MISVQEQLTRLALSILLAGIIGIEREMMHKPAGLRTHILVCLGTTVATIISVGYFDVVDPARIAASVLTGIGFLGAGTIIASKNNIYGLTTAASLWATSAVGLCIGTGLYFLGITSAILIAGVLFLGKFEALFKIKEERD